MEVKASDDKNTAEPIEAAPKGPVYPPFKLSGDTYAMAFKAMDNDVCQ